MRNLSFEGHAGGGESLNGWLSLSTDPFKSRRAQLSATAPFRGAPKTRTQNPEDVRARLRVRAAARPGMTQCQSYVSTNPVLDPLATESLWPCGRASSESELISISRD